MDNGRGRFWMQLHGRFRTDPWWAELWSGLALFGWAGWDLARLIQAGATFESNSLSDISYGVWIGSGVTLGLVQLSSLAVDEVRMRWLACSIAAIWWAALFWSRFVVNSFDASLILYAVMGAINLVGMARLRPAWLRR